MASNADLFAGIMLLLLVLSLTGAMGLTHEQKKAQHHAHKLEHQSQKQAAKAAKDAIKHAADPVNQHAVNYTTMNCPAKTECCSTTIPITFTFPFMCDAYTNMKVSDNGYISLSTIDCNVTLRPTILVMAAEIALRNSGIVGVYTTTVNGVSARVVEWSDVSFHIDHHHSLNNKHFGAFQAWLFANGSIGLVYHLLGNDFGEHGSIGVVNFTLSHPQILSLNSPNLLKTYDAFLLNPDVTDCTAAYAVSPWLTAPDICYNSNKFDSHHNTDHLHAGKFTYKPLSVCNGNFSASGHIGSSTNTNVVSKKNASITMGVVLSAVLAMLLGLVLLAAYRS